MATLAYPYYTLSTQVDIGGGKTSTKSIAAINLPDMTTDENRASVAGDLQRVSSMIAGILQEPTTKTTLTTREEVN